MSALQKHFAETVEIATQQILELRAEHPEEYIPNEHFAQILDSLQSEGWTQFYLGKYLHRWICKDKNPKMYRREMTRMNLGILAAATILFLIIRGFVWAWPSTILLMLYFAALMFVLVLVLFWKMPGE